MRTLWKSFLGLATLGLLVVPGLAQEKLTERTMKLGPDGKSPPATIADMAWLAGHWTGDALGGVSEEIWSAPQGGSMMGMYRLIRNGKPVFYELCTIVEENGSLVLRLKHFHPDLKGWEEKDKTVDFPLVALGKGAVHFEAMSFHPQGPSALTVYLVIGEKGGVREETFSYVRRPPEAK